MAGVSRSDFAHLGPAARAQIAAALAEGTTPRAKAGAKRRTAPADDSLLRCTTEGCEFPPTASVTKIEAHCDEAQHHRYEGVLA